ncbi:MAG: hypothetical protein U5L96_01025 [Owenweeksia sp.]|nr:hypothetical protein [Owenweeksia sp.]
MSHQSKLLMIFVKNPLPGKVKTRLAKDIGYEKARDYYLKLLAITRQAAQQVEAIRWLWYTDFIRYRGRLAGFLF